MKDEEKACLSNSKKAQWPLQILSVDLDLFFAFNTIIDKQG